VVGSNLVVAGNIDIGYTNNFLDVSVTGNLTSTLAISCPAGQKLLGGGGGHRDVNVNAADIVINYNGPDTTNPATKWRLVVTNNGSQSRVIRIYCNCARIN